MIFSSQLGGLRRRVFSLAACLLLAAAAAARAEEIVLTVNQTTVTRDEFVFFLEQARDGTVRRKALLKTTIARVVREKVRQQLFQSLGLMPPASFPEFLAQLEDLNRERGQAAKNGQVIYGPVRFTPLQYYGDRMAKLELQAKEKLATGRLAMTEKELRAFYRKNRESFRTPELSDWEIVTLQNSNAPINPASTAAVRQLARQIGSRMNREPDTEQICRESGDHAGVSVTIAHPKRLDNEHLGELFAGENVSGALNKLKPGRCLTLASGPDRMQIVRCVSRTAATVRPFEQVATLVRKKLLDQKYAALLDELTRSAEVKVNRATLDSIPAG